ncbi:MAG: hypothetical protein KTR19_04785 [Hyphomicrobiales bacterium]|nr:hypothetical protein [Hyphomicrobiales bacterium]
MMGRFRTLRLDRLFAVAAISMLVSILTGMTVQAQTLACPDGENWQVDKAALNKVIAALPTYMSKQQPVLINLQALGATSGELLITFSHRNLQCTADFYRGKLSGSGTVEICKRPGC